MISQEKIKRLENDDEYLNTISNNAILGSNYESSYYKLWKDKVEKVLPYFKQMNPYEKDVFINELNGYDKNNPREVRVYHDVTEDNELNNYREVSGKLADVVDHYPMRDIHELGTPILSGKDYDGFWDKVRNLVGMGPEERTYSSYYSPLQIGYEKKADSGVGVKLNERDYGGDFIPYHTHFVKQGFEDIYSGPSKIDYANSFRKNGRKGVEGDPGLLYDLRNGETLLYFGTAAAEDVKMDRFGNPIKMNGRYIVINKGNKPS